MELATKQGFKQTEIGLIPQEWRITRIGDVGKTEGGYAFKSSKFLPSGTYQVIKMSNVYGSLLDLKRSESFLNDIDDTEKKYLLKKGDILITLTGTVGKRDYGYTVLIKNEINLLLNQRVARIVIKDNAFAPYVFFQLKMPYFSRQFFEAAKGGTGNQTNVGTQQVDDMFIPLPPTLKEQKAIATALSDVDALIASLESLIAKKKAIKQGAMQQLLTPPHKGGKRLPGFSGEWVEKKLGEIAQINMGQSPLSVNYNMEGIGLPLVQGNADIKFRKTIIRNYTSQITKKADEGDIIMSVRAPVGEVAKSSFSCCIGRGVCSIKYPNEYLYHHLIWFESSWGKFSTGSTFDSINSNQLKILELVVPINEKEQKAIAETLSDMDIEIEKLETKKAKYQQLKQGMMQELLTGKTRLV